MPTVQEGETQDEFVSRCIPIVLEEGTAEDEEQASAICFSMWEESKAAAILSRKNKFYSTKTCGEKAIKDVDSVGRVVTGFFNTFNFLDSDGDVLVPGAAKKSIKERGVMSKAVAKIKHALNHDLTQLPGKLKKLEERTVDGVTGIYFESKMADTTLGNDTLKNYLEGIYDNHSIGFQYVNVEMIERGADGFKDIVDSLVNAKEAKDREAIFVVKEIALFEGSTVAFGANMNTPFLGVKGLNKDAISVSFLSRLSKLEKALRSGTQSDETMKMFELQVLQIKQAFMELNQLWTIKETPKPITTSNVIEAGKGLISEELIKNFSLK